MTDGQSFRKRTPSSLRSAIDKPSPLRKGNLRPKNLRSSRNLRQQSRRVARKIAQALDRPGGAFLEKPHSIRTGQEKQQVVLRSIGMHELQPIAACRLGRKCV